MRFASGFAFVVAAICAGAPLSSAFTRPSLTRRATLACAHEPLHHLEPSPGKLSIERLGQLAPLRAANDAEGNGDDGEEGWRINPPFALAWLAFLAFAYARSAGEVPGASQEILNLFLADPLHPGVNELFVLVFNLLGLVAVPMACLVMPSAERQKLPAAPFLAASAFAGYGGLGPYMAIRRPPTEAVSRSDLGWFTANVLENKVFNWAVVGSTLATLFVTGFAQAMLSDPGQTVRGYVDLFSDTAITSASSVDLAILSLTAASLVPEDLERRGVRDAGKANAIAASTLLFPVVGSAIYCALRPSLPEE